MDFNPSNASISRDHYQSPEAEELHVTLEDHLLVGSTPGTGGVIIIDDDGFGDDMIIIINY